MLKCFPPVRWLFSRVLKPKSPLVSLVAFMLLDPGKQPTHRWKTFSHGKISKSVEKNENKVLFPPYQSLSDKMVHGTVLQTIQVHNDKKKEMILMMTISSFCF